jgi:hypothetical protein
MLRKIGMFFLSLWLLFILITIITIDMPIYFGKNWEFVGFNYLINQNIIPIFCIVALFIGLFSYLDFIFLIKGSPNLSFEIIEIENIDYEHLTFLTTYIIPLVCFNFDNTRYQIVFFLVLFIIAIIYIKTNLFYANPTLSVLCFRIYKVSGKFRDESIQTKILITRDKLTIHDRVKFIKLDEKIFYSFKV